MDNAKAEAVKAVAANERKMVDSLKEMIKIPAISPLSGGNGESARADMLEGLISGFGIKVRRYDYIDDSKAKRSNVIAAYGGAKSTLWVISHIDTVAPGDLALWDHDPFDPVEKDGKVYGRGTTDDGQSAIGSIYALKALIDAKAQPRYNFGVCLAADEEVGSEYGIKRLLKENIFGKDDLILVPDFGTSDGMSIEIAEKGVLWLRITATGKQVHASTPELGVNAYRAMIRLLYEIDGTLHGKYNAKNPLFSPDYSTFEMTKHEANVESTNIVPGKEVSYVDCRILPEYKIDEILNTINAAASKVGADTGAKFKVEIFNREDPAPPTKSDSKVAAELANAIRSLRNKEPKFIGIGGGTVAKHFRDEGIPAAAWETCEDIAHIPNEYCKIADMVEDAKVFAYMSL